MKGSPIFTTLIAILLLFVTYLGMRSCLHIEFNAEFSPVTASPKTLTSTGHNDHNIETEIEIFFSPGITSLKITDPKSNRVLLEKNSFINQEIFQTSHLNLEGHLVELSVEAVWDNPDQTHFLELTLFPEEHSEKKVTLRAKGNISEVAEFQW